MEEIGELHPLAKRALLIDWGEWADRPTAEAIFEGMANDHLDYYLVRPVEPPMSTFTDRRVPLRVVTGGAPGRRSRSPWSPSNGHHARTRFANCSPVPVFRTASSAVMARTAAALLQRGRPVGRQVAGRNHARRACAGRPSNPELIEAFGVDITRGQPPRLRRRNRRRRTRRAYRGRVRVVRGTQHPGSRSRGSRWSGQRQLLDPNTSGSSRGSRAVSWRAMPISRRGCSAPRFLLAREATALQMGAPVLRLKSPARIPSPSAVILATGISYRRIGPALEELDRVRGSTTARRARRPRRSATNRCTWLAALAGQVAMHLCRHASHVTLVVRKRRSPTACPSTCARFGGDLEHRGAPRGRSRGRRRKQPAGMARPPRQGIGRDLPGRCRRAVPPDRGRAA